MLIKRSGFILNAAFNDAFCSIFDKQVFSWLLPSCRSYDYQSRIDLPALLSHTCNVFVIRKFSFQLSSWMEILVRNSSHSGAYDVQVLIPLDQLVLIAQNQPEPFPTASPYLMAAFRLMLVKISDIFSRF
jgi:hypothetical protein